MSVRRSCIYVIAGVNGAGKSSIVGALLDQTGAEYYNPDEIARRIAARNPQLNNTEANSLAWREGVRLLKRAIAERLDFAFETTLGANTIPGLLAKAAQAGVDVRMWYVGLSSAELHLARVRQRVERGGHDIPEELVRRRYVHSRLNLIELLPQLRSLRVFDNSPKASPESGSTPKLTLVLQMEGGVIVGPNDLTPTPDWAKSIVAAALKQNSRAV
jgi:predicted ABC-type ATPase